MSGAAELASRQSVLITGARGKIGGRLVAHMLAAGHAVVGASRDASHPPVEWPPQARFVQLDPCDDPALSVEALRGIDSVIHLAAADEVRSAADPDAATVETGLGTRRLLQAAADAGVRRFIFLSTIHVYGALLGELAETRAPKPTHPYAITHLLGEYFTRAGPSGLETVVVRLSNGIGAAAWLGAEKSRLVGDDLMRQALTQGEITLRTPGQWRDFICMSDVCAGIERLVLTPAAELGEGLFNLGGDMPLQIVDVARRAAAVAEQLTGRPVVLRMDAHPPATPPPFRFPIDRMRSVGFVPVGEAGLFAELLATARLYRQASPQAVSAL